MRDGKNDQSNKHDIHTYKNQKKRHLCPATDIRDDSAMSMIIFGTVVKLKLMSSKDGFRGRST
jgi:hypothetical protein